MEKEARKAMKSALLGVQDPVNVTYLGGIKDSEWVPPVRRKRPDGNLDRRRVIKPGLLSKVDVDVPTVLGVEFPKGQKVIVTKQETLKAGIAFKLRAMRSDEGQPAFAVEKASEADIKKALKAAKATEAEDIELAKEDSGPELGEGEVKLVHEHEDKPAKGKK